MARIVSRARDIRLRRQEQEQRPLTMLEVATQIGIDRKALSRLEANKTVRFDGEVLEKLCVFYGVGVGDILQLVEDTPETN